MADPNTRADAQADEAEHSPGPIWFLRRLAVYLQPYRYTSLLIVVLLLLEAAFGAVIPLGLRYIIDHAVLADDRGALRMTIGLLACAGLGLAGAGFVRDYLVTRTESGVLRDIRSKLFEHLQKLSLNFYSRERAGEIGARFSTDLASVEGALTTVVSWGILPALDCLTSTTILIVLNWRLALIALIVWPWCILVPRSLLRKVSAASYRMKTREAGILTAVHENASAQSVIKAFGLERLSIRLFLERNADLLRTSMRVGFLTAVLDRSAEVAIVLLQVATLAVGAAMAFNGTITIGTLASFQALFITMSYTLLSFMEWLGDLPPAAAGLERIEQILRESPAIADSFAGRVLSRCSQRIEFSGVTFAYSPERRTLNKVDVSIASGSRVAFVGPSGSGKSTMLSLLMRFYDPGAGAVTIDGQDLRDVTQASLRDQIGMVFQESVLFSATLRENIRLGRADATDMEVEEAARTAEIHEFIRSLPEGYDTQAGERGSRLSGGQRQRVAIARALIRKPAILLLDEATSALDPETEHALDGTIRRIAQGCTLIRITHRLETIAEADAIFVFDRGEVIQRGTHGDLMAAGGLYSQLWRKQSGFQWVDDGVTVDTKRLKEVPILSELDDSLLAEIRGHLTTEQFPAGRIIMHEGDAASRFYILVRGRAAVEKEGPGPSPIGLAILQDGDFFGEIALLKRSSRTATVRALQPCLCVSLSGQSFQTLLQQRPDVERAVTDLAQARLARQ